MKEKEIRYLNNNRIDYSKVSGSLPLPNLVEIQTESYKEFIETGIDAVLKDVFPIANYNGDLEIEYVSHHFNQPKYDFLECKERDMTYGAPLYVTLRLKNSTTGEIKEGDDVYMGEFPLMTDSGTFIINGAERVIVSQLVRSPGAYMSKERDKTGKFIYEGDLIPTRGTWLQFESDTKDVLSVRIDRQRKMYATILLKAIGLESDEDIENLFGVRENLHGTLEKDNEIKSSTAALNSIFSKLKPGEPLTPEGSVTYLYQKFFDPKRYDLGRAGRYKFGVKLGVYNRLEGKTLAEDLISSDGEVVYTKGHTLTKKEVEDLKAQQFFENNENHTKYVNVNTNLDAHNKVNFVQVYANDNKDVISNIVGTDLTLTEACVTIPDMLATFSYFMNIMDGVGNVDDIDHLSNRRIRCVGELIENQFRIGLSKMAKAVRDKMSVSDTTNITAKSLVNNRPLVAAIKEFFATSQLSQFMDQVNPLAELTNKRRLSALGPGGITRDRASFEVRDVHNSHYGRICPIETPEGQNVGLINNLACYAKINKYGFIETPYRKVDKVAGKVTDETVYMCADDERDLVIGQANSKFYDAETGEVDLVNNKIVCRINGENVVRDIHEIDYFDVSPKQIVSIASGCIPFLENDDTTRALMGANMQRQALPLLRPHAPFVGTGLEHLVARDAGSAVVAKADGIVKYVDSRKVVVDEENGEHTYRLQKFGRSNAGTCINQNPIVRAGQKVAKNDVLADGPAMENGDLALGQNVTIAFMTWNGYNYEDAVIMSERLVKDDVYTTIHIEEYDLECRDTKLGAEEITRDVPNVSEDSKAYLDDRGIIVPGAEVKEGDILVGKVTPKGVTEPTPEEKLLMAIFSDKTKDGKDSSLRVPHGGAGIVLDVKKFSRKNGDELAPGVNEVIRVYIVQKRKISEGDKMSGRHGNKGVISRILPVEDMPFLPDGTPVDIMLNPLGVPSRMNIGQILEVHLGMACKKLGLKIATPVFDGMTNEEIFDLMNKAGMSADGKTVLYDGRTGDRFDERITVGVMYMIKLVHMVDDKLHARATGPYSLVTQQPLGGKAQNGGQRFGEMEVWALEAYGAAHILQEILTLKSDDRVGRKKAYEAIIRGYDLPKPGIPEAFLVLQKELQALCIDIRLFDKEHNEIDTAAISKQNEAEERKINSEMRQEFRPLTPKEDEDDDSIDEEIGIDEEDVSADNVDDLME